MEPPGSLSNIQRPLNMGNDGDWSARAVRRWLVLDDGQLLLIQRYRKLGYDISLSGAFTDNFVTSHESQTTYSPSIRKRGWCRVPFWLESWIVISWTFTDAHTRRATWERVIDGLNVYSSTTYHYVREGVTFQRFSSRRRGGEYYTFHGICSHFGQIRSSTHESNAK